MCHNTPVIDTESFAAGQRETYVEDRAGGKEFDAPPRIGVTEQRVPFGIVRGSQAACREVSVDCMGSRTTAVTNISICGLLFGPTPRRPVPAACPGKIANAAHRAG